MDVGQMLLGAAHDSPEAQIQGVLEIARRHLGMETGFVSQFLAGQRIFRHVDRAGAGAPIEVGASDPLEQSYCHYIATGTMPQVMPNAADDPIAGAMAVTHVLPIGAHISVPIRLENGDLYGTLCCFSAAPDPTLNGRDLEILRKCSEVVARIIQATSARLLDYGDKRRRIEEVLEARSVDIVYQPIYRLSDDHLVSLEALTRFKHQRNQSTEVWFADATLVDMREHLEFLVLEEALASLPSLPPCSSLSVNLSPDLVLHPRFAETFGPRPVDRLILELTEHTDTDQYDRLHKALEPHRERGLRLAIDDVGAGHSSFRHVIELRPDILKLDMSLIRDIDHDRRRQALVDSVTAFGRKMGCGVVAEGVEREGELATLRAYGVDCVQGYLTGRPMPLAAATRLPPIRQRVG